MNISSSEIKKLIVEKQFDMLLSIFDNDDNDICILDGNGTYLKISDSYERHNGVKREDVIGQNVSTLMNNGVFSPSVTLETIKNRKKTTLVQTNWLGRTIMTTGTPIFDKNGNIEYIVCYNSIDIPELSTTEDKLDRIKALMNQYNISINELRANEIKDYDGIIAQSKSMQSICTLIDKIADTNANVVITGATGVGKSLLAKTIHKKSDRHQYPFVEVDCGAIPPTLIESELFGYEKGAFTGAAANGKLGRIELANKGTLFLDEIAEMPPDMQVKLLKVIQEHIITRVGGTESIEIDFRLIVATNKDLEKEVEKNNFRQDLFYRLNVIPIYIPPLKDRTEDIFPLINTFIKKFNDIHGKNINISSDAIRVLEIYDWPGNIRQLENLIERIVILAHDDTITSGFIKNLIDPEAAITDNIDNDNIEFKEMIEIYESQIINNAYEKYKTSVSVAKHLGMSQTNAARYLRKYVPEYRKK